MDEIEKAMKQAKANIEAEGLCIPEKYDELVRARLLNKMTDEEFTQLAQEYIRREKD